jgi:serine/threonine protein kinase
MTVLPDQRSPQRENIFHWQTTVEAKEKLQEMQHKQRLKTRDGFCRLVDSYDGLIITVDGKASYELGNYLGGGVAGVVYEGHRLLPMEEYPVRLGTVEPTNGAGQRPTGTPTVVETRNLVPSDKFKFPTTSFTCVPKKAEDAIIESQNTGTVGNCGLHAFNGMHIRDGSLLTVDTMDDGSSLVGSIRTATTQQHIATEDMALEATITADNMVIIDAADAPSRSKHYAKAILQNSSMLQQDPDIPSDSSLSYGIMEETVAIKVLNPVGFRTLGMDVTQHAVVARQGKALTPDILKGNHPMEEAHVWWLVNPSSRNLRTLQRYKVDRNTTGNETSTDGSRPTSRVRVDRGSPEKGLRISLIAAYRDAQGVLRELPLTRCIEIWGHVPFNTSDADFRALLNAIEAINAGQPPPPEGVFTVDTRSGGGDNGAPGRVGTDQSSSLNSDAPSLESLKVSTPMSNKRTGIYRAASTPRATSYCDELSAYIALPSVPSKYLKWLRQRRAATKEIRNMMLIGRHRNVVHLFEVLEHIQENKSTMFLILELVRGGELFDLISSNAAKISSHDVVPPGFTENETVMRKFFRELASGVRYCHANGIAHRDLKPENLLVHNSRTGSCTLKIADFGLSAAFGPQSQSQTDQDILLASLPSTPVFQNASSPPRTSDSDIIVEDGNVRATPLHKMERMVSAGMSFFNCGIIDDVVNCRPSSSDGAAAPSPLKRMTSVVGSPHYVAPEIISQSDRQKSNDQSADEQSPSTPLVVGYDGTRADVWSAGVILYAMLFRSLPFGEDLLRCARFQSYTKWYSLVKKAHGRRSSAAASLNPVITEADERDFLGPHWFFPSPSSPESRDLIVSMLHPDADQRPTVEMVLQHPWLLKQA